MPIYNDDLGEENIPIKKPSDEKPLTEEQKIEWLKCRDDKFYWMRNYVWVQSDLGSCLFTPRDYQSRIINLFDKTLLNIVQSGRQTGKTATLSVDMMHDMIFHKDIRVGFTSYTQTNVDDVRERIGFIYENLPNWMKPPALMFNQKKIVFKHKSSIQFQVTSKKTFRGKSLTYIVIDELAHVEHKIAEEFMGALLPSITGAGTKAKTKLMIISTPVGTSGVFAQLWFDDISGKNGFVYTKVEYEEIPNRGEEFEQSMIKKIGKDLFNQEYRCHMISNKGTLVNSRIIENMSSKAPVDEIGDLRVFVDDLTNRRLMMACDVSEGIGKDSHVIQVFDLDSLEQVAEYENNVMTQTHFSKEIIKTIQHMFESGVEEIYYTVENNGVGNGVLRLLENSQNKYLEMAIMISEENKTGLTTTGKTKKESCSQFKDLCESHRLKINSERLITQLKFFYYVQPISILKGKISLMMKKSLFWLKK